MSRPRNNNRDDFRRASGSLNKRSIRNALFDAAARSADSFSSVAGRWSLSRRRRSRAASDHKSRIRKRRSFHTNNRTFDDGTPAMHTNTPFVIATTADHHRSNAHQQSQSQSQSSNPSFSRYASFGSDAPSAGSLRTEPDARFVHPALRPTFDGLRLLRKIPQVMAGWVHLKLPTGPGRLRWSTWHIFWAELRGGYILLTRENNSFASVSDSSCQNPVDYIFGATHCTISKTTTRSGAVRLRLIRASARRRTESGTATSSGIADDDDLMRLPDNNPRLSERSNKTTSSDKSRLGSAVRKLVAPFRQKNTPVDLLNGHPEPADLVMKIPNAPEADKWEWALRNATNAYESKPLGDFQLIDALGAGAFGRVYLVHDCVKQQYLAMKVLDKNLVFRDRLHFESAINERLTLELVRGKPFMAQLRYAFQTSSCLYLITDFYEGGDLFSFLRAHHNDVRESQAIRIIAEVILALQSMHEMGIVYRDLKPENVLLDREGHVRLADLGLAKLLDRDNDYLTSTICGSLSYAAPEMLSEKQYGIGFDMWTLGVFIYQVLTGDMPFDTENRSRQEILEDQRKAEIPMNGLSEDGYALVCALLRVNPLRRPTCQDLQKFAIFDGINWDELAAKRPHKNSVKEVMEKIAKEARKEERSVPTSEAIGGESDVYLLRNFDPDEWSDMSFSDESDGRSTVSFFRPDFAVSDELPALTRMVPGWSLTTDNAIPLVKPQLAVPPHGKKSPVRSARRMSEKRYR